ncbi:nitroreductase/quinone reductase family protein [Kitasatospora sp. NPDC088160]|uniref:nitroreductase/quinone reductase family protein n=1 Tax=Kitasatospora sp. NPDC088160 TaxID=3364072 RepID=UPI003817B42B
MPTPSCTPTSRSVGNWSRARSLRRTRARAGRTRRWAAPPPEKPPDQPRWPRGQPVESREESCRPAAAAQGGYGECWITVVGPHVTRQVQVQVQVLERRGLVRRVGAPKNPTWYHNLVAHPRVELQGGGVRQDMTAREVEGAERELWWSRAVEVWPDYAEYQTKTDRVVPVFVLEPETAGR